MAVTALHALFTSERIPRNRYVKTKLNQSQDVIAP